MSQEFISKTFKQATENTFCLIPSLSTEFEVSAHEITTQIIHGSTMNSVETTVLPINSSTRTSKTNWGYVCVDTTLENYENVEKVYKRVMKPDDFIAAIHAAIKSQEP